MQGYPPQGYGPPGQGFSPPQTGGEVGRLELYSKFFPLMWFLYFTKLRVTVDGDEQARDWGRISFDLPAGTHHVKVHFPNLFGPGGKAECMFQIWPGHTTKLTYSAPFLFAALSGTLIEAGTQPIAQLPAGY